MEKYKIVVDRDVELELTPEQAESLIEKGIIEKVSDTV